MAEPGFISPLDLSKNPDYREVANYPSDTQPDGDYCVFEHIASGDLWRAFYNIRKSPWDVPTIWRKVQALHDTTGVA